MDANYTHVEVIFLIHPYMWLLIRYKVPVWLLIRYAMCLNISHTVNKSLLITFASSIFSDISNRWIRNAKSANLYQSTSNTSVLLYINLRAYLFTYRGESV